MQAVLSRGGCCYCPLTPEEAGAQKSDPLVQDQMTPSGHRFKKKKKNLQIRSSGSLSQSLASWDTGRSGRGLEPCSHPCVGGRKEGGDIQSVPSVPSQPAGRDPEKKVAVVTRIPRRVSHGTEEPFGGWDLEKVSKVDSFSRQPLPLPPRLRQGFVDVAADACKLTLSFPNHSHDSIFNPPANINLFPLRVHSPTSCPLAIWGVRHPWMNEYLKPGNCVSASLTLSPGHTILRDLQRA